jgi:hypothetical protein
MSVSTRNLGGISDAATQDNVICIWDFVRLDIASPVGTKCFTNKPCDSTGLITLNLGGAGSFDWLDYDVVVGPVVESMQNAATINFVKFGNVSAQNTLLDKQWTKWASSPGLRGASIYIYRAQFDPITDSFLGGYLRFFGELGGGTFKDEATITVKPKDTTSVKESPDKPIGSLCVNLYRGPDCGYTGAEPGVEVTCDFSRGACNRRANELNFNGFDRVPADGAEQEWLG